MASQPHSVEGVYDKISPGAILVPHFNGVGFAMQDRFEGGLLADDTRAEH